MDMLKNSLIASASLMLLVGVLAVLPPAVRRAQGSGEKKPTVCEPRRFYLTTTTHDGNETLTACAAGYHMASLWEILDPSNLKYDTALGVTNDDSGFGPPSGFNTLGWIRTGFEASALGEPAGRGNCNAWTTDVSNGETFGTVVTLSLIWSSNGREVSPWSTALYGCSSSRPVWCVQD